jgi:hypothetical protein
LPAAEFLKIATCEDVASLQGLSQGPSHMYKACTLYLTVYLLTSICSMYPVLRDLCLVLCVARLTWRPDISRHRLLKPRTPQNPLSIRPPSISVGPGHLLSSPPSPLLVLVLSNLSFVWCSTIFFNPFVPLLAIRNPVCLVCSTTFERRPWLP